VASEPAARTSRKRDTGRRESLTSPKRGEELLTLAEAARRSGVPARTLNRAALVGHLKAIRLGYQWAVTQHDVDAYLKEAPHRPGSLPGQGSTHSRRPGSRRPADGGPRSQEPGAPVGRE
jgi:excisionase family DNA binding protein